MAPAEARLRDGHSMDYILDTEFHCDDFRRELGEPVHEHADPDKFRLTLDDLVAMHDYAECPLHLTPRYPLVPEGVWKRQYHLATVALDKLTEKHTGVGGNGVRFACPDDGCDCCDRDGEPQPARYVATTAELRQVWKDYPHARWVIEADAEDGLVNIEPPEGNG